MDQDTRAELERIRSEFRAEIEKLHARDSDLKERVVVLEAQQPHISAALLRIENSVKAINGHIVKAIWIILGGILAAAVGWMLKGGFHIPGV